MIEPVRVEPVPMSQPNSLGREWLEGLNRELRRHDNCLEDIRKQCLKCHEVIAKLRSDVGHLRDDIARMSDSIECLQKKNTAAVKEVDDKLDKAKEEWHDARVKIAVIWSGVAAVVALIVTAIGNATFTRLFG